MDFDTPLNVQFVWKRECALYVCVFPSCSSVADHRKLQSAVRCGGYLPFPLVTSSPPRSLHNTDTSITLPTRRVKGQSHFSALPVPSPLTDPFPGVTASCRLTSHQFTRGEGAVSVGSPPSPLPHTPPPSLHTPVLGSPWQTVLWSQGALTQWDGHV